jgi:hypothetical protein
VTGDPPADPWRPYHRSQFTYLVGADVDASGWQRIDRDRDLVTALATAGWDAGDLAPGPV